MLSREELEVAIDPKSGAYALMRELCHPHDVADLDLGPRRTGHGRKRCPHVPGADGTFDATFSL